MRQTQYRLAADRLELELADPSLSAAARAAAEAQLARYRETIARYDNEPDPNAPGDSLRGEGKKQLSAQARPAARRPRRAPGSGSGFAWVVFLGRWWDVGVEGTSAPARAEGWLRPGAGRGAGSR